MLRLNNKQDKDPNPTGGGQDYQGHPKHKASHSPTHQRGKKTPKLTSPHQNANTDHSQHEAYMKHWLNRTITDRSQTEEGTRPYSLDKGD